MTPQVTPSDIGPYRVLRPIAAGGMAEVYEVEDPGSGERFALKLLVAVEEALPRFDREYEAMTRLNHPGIVRVYHYGIHDDHPWLTMELLRGVPAQTHVKAVGKAGTPDRTAEVLRVGYHVAQALNYIHERGLVHRDLKSANVLVLPDGRVKLLDFGAALIRDAERITRAGDFVGTFAYASPEQLTGKEVNARSDIYSLGVLLFRLATGKQPFDGGTPEEIARAHVHLAPKRANDLRPTLPKALADLIDRMLQKDPHRRPQRAREVAEYLEALAGRPFHDRSQLAVHNPISVAREAERRGIWGLLQAEVPPPWIAIVGEDGSDRVRLLQHIEHEASGKGFVAMPLDLRRADPIDRLLDVIVRMVGSGSDAARAWARQLDAARRKGGLELPTVRGELMRLTAEALRARTRGNPDRLLLCIQEVHLAEVLLLEMLGGILKGLRGQTDFVVLTASRPAPVAETTSDLRRRLPDPHVVELEPLTAREVAIAVGTMLGRRPPPAELARHLHRVTAGQPLYLEEAVRGMVGSGGIEADGSRLAWADQAMDIPVPPRAHEVASDLLAEVPLVRRRVLEALSIAGEDTGLPMLARLVGRSTQELMPDLTALDQDGLVALDRVKMRVRWRQPVLALILADQLHPCRRSLLQRSLATISRGVTPRPELVEAQIAVSPIDDLLRSALPLVRQLIQRHAFRTALDLLDDLAERLPQEGPHAEAAEAHLLHSAAIRAVRPADPAGGRALSRARALAPPGDADLACRMLLHQARLFGGIGHYRNALKFTEQAWESLPDDGYHLAAEIALDMADAMRLRGELTAAEQWFHLAIEHAERAGDRPLRWIASAGAGACLVARGRIQEAEALLAQTMQEAERAGADIAYTTALASWTEALRLQGRYSEALALLYERLPHASQHQDPRLYVQLLLATAWIELDLSRLGRAQECTDTLAATVHRGELLHVRLEVQLLNGRILLASGQLREAAYVLQDVQDSANKADLLALRERARAVLAEALHALGDTDAAQGLFQSATLGLMGSGEQTLLAESIRAQARVTARSVDPEHLFQPVTYLVESEPVAMLHLDVLLASATWFQAQGDEEGARDCHSEAARILDELAEHLNDTDRAALRVHPWTQWVRRGLSERTTPHRGARRPDGTT